MARRRHDQLIHEPCGVFRDEAFDPENEGWFEVIDDEDVCYACAAYEEWREAQQPGSREHGAQVVIRLEPHERRERGGGELAG